MRNRRLQATLLLALAWLSVFTPAQSSGEEAEKGAPGLGRVAFVDIQLLFRSYEKVTEAQKEIDLARALIARDNRTLSQGLAELRARIAVMERKLASPSMQGPVATGERETLEKDIFLRRQEWLSREQRRERQTKARNQELDRKMMARMNVLLGEVQRLSAKSGEMAGFDLVFDLSGANSTHVPPVLYAKEAVDITPIVLKELNKSSPREPLAERGKDGR